MDCCCLTTHTSSQSPTYPTCVISLHYVLKRGAAYQWARSHNCCCPTTHRSSQSPTYRSNLSNSQPPRIISLHYVLTGSCLSIWDKQWMEASTQLSVNYLLLDRSVFAVFVLYRVSTMCPQVIIGRKFGTKSHFGECQQVLFSSCIESIFK